MLFADVEHLDVGVMFLRILTGIVQVDRHDFSCCPIDRDGRGLWVARWQEDVLTGDFHISRSRHGEIICTN